MGRWGDGYGPLRAGSLGALASAGVNSGMAEHSPEPCVSDVFVFSREAVRELDRRAVEEFGIPSIVLMENAAIHLAEAVLDVLEDEADEDGAVLVVAGTGSNGGDGLAAARHLANSEVPVHILLAGEPGRARGDAATNLRIVQAMGLPMTISGEQDAAAALRRLAGEASPAVLVDALYGTGVSGALRSGGAALVAAINEIGEDGAFIVSADVPSGLDAETGEALGVAPHGAVRADVTVTFAGLKRGFLTLAAQGHVGDIMVADIGAPMELAASLGEELPEEVERPGDAHAEPSPQAGRPGGRGGGRGRGKGGR